MSHDYHWPGPRSLATTCGVSVDVLSFGYLDVSVPRVRLLSLCIQNKIPNSDTWKPKQFPSALPKATPSQGRPAVAPDGARRRRARPPKAVGTAREPNNFDFPSIIGGFPHSEIAGSKLIRSSPTLIAAYHVLHRLCMPRHPPIALKTLDHSHCQYPSLFRYRMVLVQKVCQLFGAMRAVRAG